MRNFPRPRYLVSGSLSTGNLFLLSLIILHIQYLPIFLFSIHPSIIHLPISPCVNSSIQRSIDPSIHLRIYSSSINSSIHPSFHPSVHLFVHLYSHVLPPPST